jgi:aminoglycoside phosphotransferase (APT) family kinase protein
MSDLVHELIRAANLSQAVDRVEPVATQGAINRHDLVVLEDGSQFVARTYRWPFDEPSTIDRQSKEEWLLPLLREASVPVPEVIASVPGAVLTSYVAGELLAEVPTDLRAWTDAGRTLAIAHEIVFDRAGLVVAGGVDPFREGSWGAWTVGDCERNAVRLAARRSDLRVDPAEVRAVVAAAQPLLDAQPVRLLHNDPHPWNILVRGGRCVAWLDWEFAWAADPTWDLVRNALFRMTDIGPTPKEFYEGYGREPDPVLFAVGELVLYLWMANESRYSDTVSVTYAAAERYVADLPARLARLRRLVG